MNKKILSVCIIVFLNILLSSCSKQSVNQIANDNKLTHISADTKNKENIQKPKIFSVGIDSANKVEEYKSFIKDNLKPDMSKDQVVGLFGSNYNEVIGGDSDEYGKFFWRYDLLAQEGYNYYNEFDGVDIEGLTIGRVKIILSVSFSKESKVQNYSFFYLDDVNKCIKAYDVLNNGAVKDEWYAAKSPSIGKVDLLALPIELLDVYDKYSKTRNDEQLKGLKALEICRLYFFAEDKQDYETVYALYIHDKNYLVPMKEEFLNDIKNDKVGQENSKKLLKVLKENIQSVMVFDNRDYADIKEGTADIQVNFDKETIWGRTICFHLIKDSKGIWKVQFMPLQ